MVSTTGIVAEGNGASSRLIGCVKELGTAGWDMMGVDKCCFAVLSSILVDCVVFPVNVSF